MDEFIKLAATSLISFLLGGGAISAYIAWRNSKRETETQKAIAVSAISGTLLREQLERVNTIRDKIRNDIGKSELSARLRFATSLPRDDNKKEALYFAWESDDRRMRGLADLYEEIVPYLRADNLSVSYFTHSEAPKDYGKNLKPNLARGMFYDDTYTSPSDPYQKQKGYRQQFLRSSTKQERENTDWRDAIFSGYRLDILYDKSQRAWGAARALYYRTIKDDGVNLIINPAHLDDAAYAQALEIAVDYLYVAGDFERELAATLDRERDSIIAQLHTLGV